MWIDVARGIGILLVVFGHVWRGLFSAGLIADELGFRLVDRAVYLFHMPLFFVVSGMFLERGVRSRGVLGSLVHRCFAIAYPYFLWSYLNMYAKYLVGSEVNLQVNIHQLLNSYYPPVMQFWFLFHLFIIQTILSFFVLSDAHNFKIYIWLACLAILFGQVPNAGDVVPPVILLLLPNLVFFVVGMALGGGRLVLPDPTARILWSAAAVFCAAQILYAYLPPSIGDPLKPVLALACIVAVLLAAKAMAGATRPFLSTVAMLIAAAGVASMAVFVTHVMFTAGVRIAIERLGGASVVVHCILGTAVGLAGPYAMFLMARSFNVLWLAGFGTAPRLRWAAQSRS